MSVEEVRLDGWPKNIRVFYTTRTGGYSGGAYAGLNLGLHVGDREEAVLQNRAELREQLPDNTAIAWLNQVHSTRTVSATNSIDEPLDADACWTASSRVACAVMVADCLPVLLADNHGQVVAAVHAGWRGLADGVLESAVKAMAVDPQELCAWLGPAIGKDAFEVGPEVRSVFLERAGGLSLASCFRPSPHQPGHYLADLAQLATLRLEGLGLTNITGLNACTVSNSSRFFSYRRDGDTGRMACLILRDN